VKDVHKVLLFNYIRDESKRAYRKAEGIGWGEGDMFFLRIWV
jgi:hypothetical protein